ncbi:MAG TPA: hypothetical protein VMY34_07460, partial [Acidimicrobiales bacterium]|nr:hypothetical protein [Acidimicrobiales bacterium]
ELWQLAGELRSVEDVRSDSGWSTYAQFRSLLEAAATVMGGVDTLVELGRKSDLFNHQNADHSEMVQRLGSPAALYGILDMGHTIITTIVAVETEQIGETEWLVRAHYEDGFEAFEANCEYSRGMFGMIPRVFGHPNAEVVEETCQRRGDRVCTFRVRWHALNDDAARADYFERRALLLEGRIIALNNTVEDLVSTEKLDVVLTRIVASAAKAVHAPGFVLAIDAFEGSPAHVLANGVSDPEAERVAALLRANTDAPGVMVATVASSRRQYGWLAAVDPDGVALPQSLSSLESYARLAATALDSATALADSRAQEARAQALLELSTSLAEIVGLDEVAAKLAEAIPAVTGCDGAVVIFVDDVTGVSIIKGVAGIGAVGEQLLGAEVPSGEESVGLRYHDRSNAKGTLAALMESTGTVSVATVPISVDGNPVGWVAAAVNDRPERLAPSVEL